MTDTFAAPSLHDGIIAAGGFALSAACWALAVRPLLRNPIFPRKLTIPLVIGADHFGSLLTRTITTNAEYHANFREGPWVDVWAGLFFVVFITVLFWRNHIIPVAAPPIDAPAPAEVAAAARVNLPRQR